MKEGIARENIQKAIEAKDLLKNPVLVNAFESIKEELLKFIENSTPDQSQEREEAYHQLHALKTVNLKINKVIDDGKIAEKVLEGMEQNNNHLN